MAIQGDSAFSRNLRKLRKKRGLTQYDLADMTGISRRMIGHYETQAVQPPIENLELIAKALKVKTADLLTTEALEAEDEVDPTQFDSRSLKKLKDILSLPQTDRADLYRMLNPMRRENRNKQETKKESNTIQGSTRLAFGSQVNLVIVSTFQSLGIRRIPRLPPAGHIRIKQNGSRFRLPRFSLSPSGASLMSRLTCNAWRCQVNR
jgi:transcriptional regulator with XRE-family HTH domain